MVAFREPPTDSNRTVVLALPRSPLSALAAIQLRSRGWTVFQAGSSDHARRLAAEYLPAAVVLSADSDDESGWLTCAKLKLAQPRLRVLLVGDDDGDAVGFAEYVRAALVPHAATAGDLIAELEAAGIPA